MKKSETKEVPCCVCGKVVTVPADFNEEETYCLGCYKVLKRRDVEMSAWFIYFKESIQEVEKERKR